MVLGLDLDNTLVSYDRVIRAEAVRRRLIPPGFEGAKRAIRDRIRELPDGEIEWQKLQAFVYGPGLPRAELIPGVPEFLEQAGRSAHAIYVISHKTRFANYDETGTDLRLAAMQWMRDQRFFEKGGLGLDPQRVYFESTRAEKVRRIAALGCTHFIDDLEETFREDGFPGQVNRLLYAPVPPPAAPVGVRVFANWDAIRDHLFAAC